MKQSMKRSVKKSIFVLALALAATVARGETGSFAAKKASGAKDAAVERTRQEVKMLDDLYKTTIVLNNENYVNKPSDFSAIASAKEVFATIKKGGWHEVRVLGLTDAIKNPDNEPRDAFEQAAAKKLIVGQTPDEEVVKKGGKRYLRVATGIPVVGEKCIMCHENYKGNKGNVGALSYTVPVNE
ncbi:MAG: c-type heme family protein [Methylocella sp.]